MEIDDKSNTMMATGTQDLLEERDLELKKVLKLKLILNEIRNLNLGPEETPEIKRALKLVSVADYIRLGDDQEHLLGKRKVLVYTYACEICFFTTP